MESTGCAEFPAQAKGKIVHVQPLGCSTEHKILNCQNAGCLGIFFNSQKANPGFDSYSRRDHSDLPSVALPPIAEYSRADNVLYTAWYASVVEKKQTNLAQVEFTYSPNPWRDDLINSAVTIVLFRIFLSGWTLFNIFFSVYKIYYLVKLSKLNLVSASCLTIEFFCNLFRFIYFVVDPIYSSQTFDSLTARILYELTFPWGVYTSIIITFYWWSSMQKAEIVAIESIKFKFFLKYILTGIITIMMLGEYANAVLVGSHLDFLGTDRLASISGVLLGLTQLFCSVVYFYTAWKMMKKMVSTAVEIKKALKKIMTRVVISGIGMISFTVFFWLSPIQAIYYTIGGFVTINFFIFVSVQITSTMQIAALVTAKEGKEQKTEGQANFDTQKRDTQVNETELQDDYR